MKNIISLLLIFAFCILIILLILLHYKNFKKAEAENRLLEERRQFDLEYQKNLFHQAHFDALTGIYNREFFIHKTEKLIENNPNETFVIYRIDIQRFTLINDTFGTAVGDELLVYISSHIKKDLEKLNNFGTYGRIYADQFAIAIPKKFYNADILKKNLSQIFTAKNCSINFKIYIGIYMCDEHTLQVEQMLDRSMLALQSIKGNYTKHVCIYNHVLFNKLLAEQKILNEMEYALSAGQFEIFLQPQYSNNGTHLIGAEALVRWNHPTNGIITPNNFISLFERNGFITKLDEYIWENTCKIISHLYHDLHVEFPISVNVSRVDISNCNIPDTFAELVEKYNIPPNLLHLEITESSYMDNPDELINVSTTLRKRGFIVEMDDFGSGYSSLNMLKDVPVDILKLDMLFLYNKTDPKRGNNILNSIVKMAHALSLSVITEGVETVEQANFLDSIGCQMIQGYLYGKPMTVTEFEKILVDSKIENKNFIVSARFDLKNLEKEAFNMKNIPLHQEYYNVNGAIYIPSNAYNVYQMWKNYDSVKTKRDISLAKKIKLNALRIWVSYEYWLEDSSSFVEKLEDLLKICSVEKIRVLVSLFERCGQEPTEYTLNDTNPQTATATKSPGTVITKNSDFWDKPISFVQFFMKNYKNRKELLAIEVMNEPALGEDNLDFAVEMFKNAALLKGDIPLTIGSISIEYNLYFMEYGLDILQYHDNFPKSVEEFEANLQKAQDVQDITGHPVWLTEWQRIRCGTQGWDGEPIAEDELGPKLSSLAPSVKKYQIGNFFWSLMLKPAYLPGQRKAGTFNGLFRDDGTAYSDDDVDAISSENFSI